MDVDRLLRPAVDGENEGGGKRAKERKSGEEGRRLFRPKVTWGLQSEQKRAILRKTARTKAQSAVRHGVRGGVPGLVHLMLPPPLASQARLGQPHPCHSPRVRDWATWQPRT